MVSHVAFGLADRVGAEVKDRGGKHRGSTAVAHALNQMIERPDVQKRMAELGLTVLPPEQRTPEHLATFLPKDIARWGKVISEAGLAGMAGK